MKALITKPFLSLTGVIVLNLIFGSICLAQTDTYKKQVADLQSSGAVWIPDQGDGNYTNPIIDADYSDPDAIRVGDDYYMTASSFSHFPGLPILHSKDLVNWEIIGYAAKNYPYKTFDKPQHGNGIWAPSIRYHKGMYYIYYGDPDYGIFMTKAKNPTGPWEPLRLIREAKGWINCCPLWDDDGNTYLVHAWANSRSGIKSIITVNKMSADGEKILDDGTMVFDAHVNHPTMEGPKFYKRNGYYYIFAQAGGVKPGWQTVLRSKNIYGPFEDKIVLEQGSTKINGPHQGAWVTTQTDEDWFLHFQNRYAFGRIVHLEPMKWVNDWPVIGEDHDKNGIGEPVEKYKKPNVGKDINLVKVPQTNDEFDSKNLGLQWQWQANPKPGWISLTENKGWLRFNSQVMGNDDKNLRDSPSLLMQKFPARQFSATTLLELNSKQVGEKAGLIIFGMDYSYIGIVKKDSSYALVQNVCNNADRGNPEAEIFTAGIQVNKIYLRVSVKQDLSDNGIPQALCSFSFSFNGQAFIPFGKEFKAREGKWVGAKVGIFTYAPKNSAKVGYTDFDWFRFTK